jgi:hypothetical protein
VPVNRSIMITESDWLIRGALDMGDLITSIYDRANKKDGPKARSTNLEIGSAEPSTRAQAEGLVAGRNKSQ